MGDAVGGAQKVNGTNGYPSSYAAKFDLPPHFIGGNELSKAPPSKVKDFVTANDGHTVITNVSIFQLAREDSRELGVSSGMRLTSVIRF